MKISSVRVPSSNISNLFDGKDYAGDGRLIEYDKGFGQIGERMYLCIGRPAVGMAGRIGL